MKKPNPTLKLLLAAGVLLILAAVLAYVFAGRKPMHTVAGPSVAETQIAQLLPDLQGRKRNAAVRKINKIVMRNSHSASALSSAMAVYSVSGMNEEAARMGERYLAGVDSGKFRPKPSPAEVAEVASATGMVCSEIGANERALQHTERALKAFPNNATYLNNLGYFLADQGKDLPRALELTRHAVELAPTNPSFVDSYGWALYMSGKYKQSLKPLMQATELEPNSAEVRYHLGNAYIKNNRIDEARIELKKSLIIENKTEVRRLLKSIER